MVVVRYCRQTFKKSLLFDKSRVNKLSVTLSLSIAKKIARELGEPGTYFPFLGAYLLPIYLFWLLPLNLANQPRHGSVFFCVWLFFFHLFGP